MKLFYNHFVNLRLRSEINGSFQFKLAPNPAKDKVTILLQMMGNEIIDYHLFVTDLVGKMVYKRSYSATETSIPLEIDHWAKGIYFVSIQRDGHVVTQKLVIE